MVSQNILRTSEVKYLLEIFFRFDESVDFIECIQQIEILHIYSICAYFLKTKLQFGLSIPDQSVPKRHKNEVFCPNNNVIYLL